jgi:hypothetical protein
MSAHTLAQQEAMAALEARFGDPMWRICSGELYKIIIKGDGDGDDGLVMPFKPNRAQRRFIKRMWHRNVIVKARQLGFTTLICILWLDHALFNPNSRCGIIAQDRETAEAIFSDKVKFAYENLPDELRAAVPLKKCTATELRFSNNSVIRVATSVRGGTIHRLHVSEFGKICAKYPDKAREVVTGSIPAVPKSGVLVIESTTEGRDGEFYEIATKSDATAQEKRPLTPRDYRLHFYAWWQEPNYRLPAGSVPISEKDHAYFDALEAEVGHKIDIEQRNWYIATRDSDFAGRPERMWQEYPSTFKESFQVSTEGTYYREQIAAVRRDGRLTDVPYLPGIPVNTFWDIGHGDGTAIWFHQQVGLRDHFIKFIEGWGEPYAHFVKEMQKLGYVWGTHYLPHDGAHVRQGELENLSPQQMLVKLGLQRVEIVPVVSELQHGISATRDAFATCLFDKEGTKEGFTHLEMYRKKFNEQQQCYTDQPLKNIHTEGADSFRQFAQARAAGMIRSAGGSSGNWKRKTTGSWRAG